ncbi:electron transport complex subunit RsxC [Beggiatoa leptomitoformis]|uniref:Ion-translocating oxidoreductase complex subunit C n=1 Tax=Beggiatoa leptomitoformis TaxID=288004 RepID=A0A2N9YIT6_9GAMM|nr:electron transport complex subunit RsxC [Beggiatoa leptomitoformis]ALG67454.1 electron transport complex subunit RsxC [Beggiatoa leptomitoformis]AUI70329.1 electron transport complex subunit RsxC [Beggiatoa leptomitoformis]
MKLFRFSGGIHPEGRKHATTDKPIQKMPMPHRLYVPLQQHVGAPAEPQVKVGEHVLKGQLLAHSQGMISAPVHSPTSGIIVEIGDFTAPHPSGLPVRTIIIESDGEDRWMTDLHPAEDPLRMPPDEVAARVGMAGIVGMGGATFPASVKLKQSLKNKVHTFIVNGSECEPYLTCDDRLMQERAEQLIDGTRIVLHAAQVAQAYIAVEDNKPAAIEALTKACRHITTIKVVAVPSLYPMGSAQHLIKTVTGQEVPADGRSSDIGLLVHNVGTVYAIHRALRHGEPLISRVITVGGGAVTEPINVEVPIGALVSDVLAFCGGLKQSPARLLVGGPMMGQILPTTATPVVKGTNGIVALTAEEITQEQTMPCIRCGSCVTACPCGLLPLQMAAFSKAGNFDKVDELGLVDCISCGSCSYVCPSHIPLVHYFNYAKGELLARELQKHKAQEHRRLVDQRKERLDREIAAKAAAAAKRKADAEKKKKVVTEA